MKRPFSVIAGLLLAAMPVMAQTSFDSRIHADFQKKKEALPHGDLFNVFQKQLTQEERDALTFYYAYMPVGVQPAIAKTENIITIHACRRYH